jgi:hypothetical protein
MSHRLPGLSNGWAIASYAVALPHLPRGSDAPVVPLAAHRRPRRRWPFALGALGLVCAAVLAAAWFGSPSPSNPGGAIRARLRATGGQFVPLSAVAPVFREAVVATEDERFWRHHGIDVIGIGRALAYDVGHLSLSQGASTITEQLAKDLYLGGNDHSPWRKLEDAAVAVRLEAALSKDQILEDYLNSVYFGDQAYGIGAASERYFGVAPARLDLARASLLAGIIQAPSSDDPFVDPSAARLRQADVLASMVRNGYITGVEARQVMDRPLRLADGRALPPEPGVSVAPAAAFSGPEMAAGIGLAILGLLALLVSRRRFRGLIWRLAPAATLVVGVWLATRALHGD